MFSEFLRQEYSEENMLFWAACEELKQERDPAVLQERAHRIYEDYVSVLSPKEVCNAQHIETSLRYPSKVNRESRD